MIIFQDLTQDELAELLLPLSRVKKKRLNGTEGAKAEAKLEVARRKQARYRARQIFHWVYQRYVTDWQQMTDLSKELRAWLCENVRIHRLGVRVNPTSIDGTRKFLWELSDSKTVESVIIPAALKEKGAAGDYVKDDDEFEDAVQEVGSRFAGNRLDRRYADPHIESRPHGERGIRLTACISSQVGCAMGCRFCLTGVQGLDRHLKTHEIVTQVHELRMRAPITNIVFMGMGEPLHNVDNVIKACRILLDQDGMNFSKRKITVSTSGLVPAIRKLGESVGVSLAISLNGSNDEQREKVMPVNKRWKINELLDACRDFPLGKHRRITFEYVMIQGLNDSLDDAERVYRLLRGIPSKVNLIPMNEHAASEFKRPDDETVYAFQNHLVQKGLTCTVRISRGRDILAACGQLRSIFGTARGTERHSDWTEVPATF